MRLEVGQEVVGVDIIGGEVRSICSAARREEDGIVLENDGPV